jgi:hypothetical protein
VVLRTAASEPIPAPASAKNSLQRHQQDRNQPATPFTDIYSANISCPLGGVEAIMRKQSDGIFSTTPESTLVDIIPLLNKVTGLPVIDNNGVVMGVIR